ncbi:MAG: hypothetical protein L6R36_006432 [Xanthoria steineri]|nr:MAG: hypothetical protein L6R36_006432 [Xanthoria steineri]
MTQIIERVGDIFDSPPNSILIHACNTKGSWGAGVAAAFKKYSPAAFHHQRTHCTTPSSSTTSISTYQRSLLGTCLLIPPFPTIKHQPGKPSPPPSKPTTQQTDKKFWIACLFTSSGYGKNVDTPSAILRATESAVSDLGRQISDGKEQGCEMGECYSVRINSGLFGVPWRDTKRVLRMAGVDMVVVRPESQKDEVVESDGDGEVGVEDVQPESNSGVLGVDGTVGGKEEKKVRGKSQDVEETDVGKISKGLKRKSAEDGRDENGKKTEGGGRQTKLNFGKCH